MFPPSLDDTTRNFVFFKHESLFQHKTIWVNYTTYDMRHELILSSQKGLVATSCYPQIILVVQTHQICTTLSMQECWVYITPMWYILGLGCRTLRLAPSKCYGCNGMRLLIQGLQDGLVQQWTCCTFHPYTKTIPLALCYRFSLSELFSLSLLSGCFCYLCFIFLDPEFFLFLLSFVDNNYADTV